MRLPTPRETMLFRIAQEAISNIIHHANASLVSIRLWTADQHIWLEIKDNGCGFDIDNIYSSSTARKPLGILGIRERASLVHGEVKINSSKDSGTCLQVYIPMPALDPALDSFPVQEGIMQR
jgi:signal transduction histidine kinase